MQSSTKSTKTTKKKPSSKVRTGGDVSPKNNSTAKLIRQVVAAVQSGEINKARGALLTIGSADNVWQRSGNGYSLMSAGKLRAPLRGFFNVGDGTIRRLVSNGLIVPTESFRRGQPRSYRLTGEGANAYKLAMTKVTSRTVEPSNVEKSSSTNETYDNDYSYYEPAYN